MSERQRAHADGASASESGGHGVRGRRPQAVTRRTVAAATLAALVATACGFSASTDVREITEDELFGLDQTTTTSTTTTTTPETTPVSAVEATFPPTVTTTPVITESVELYFLDGAGIERVSQNLSSPTSLSRVLDALVTGPPDGEAGIGLRSALPTGVVDSVTPAGGVASVDLVGEVYEQIDTVDELPAIAQMVLTLTAQSGVGQVRFTLDGEPLPVRLGSNLVSGPGEAVSRDDYAGLLTNEVDPSVPPGSDPVPGSEPVDTTEVDNTEVDATPPDTPTPATTAPPPTSAPPPPT